MAFEKIFTNTDLFFLVPRYYGEKIKKKYLEAKQRRNLIWQ